MSYPPDGAPVRAADRDALRLADGEIAWGALAAIDVVTSADGPFVEDVWFTFAAAHGRRAWAGHERAGELGLVDRLLALPGFDHERFIDAMASSADATFPVWRAPGA
ncbi:MAG TPA: hypothetical protein PKA64_15255 [Myxococcota bacterium]|nr:hypothetical protein [Myxococcota bacterium]